MMIQPTGNAPLQGISQQDLQNLGMNEVAYIKPAVIEGRSVVAIHAANGTPITATDTRDKAIALIRQNDLEPMPLH